MAAAEKYIATANDYVLNRIPQGRFDVSQGVDPYSVRYSTAPAQDAEYIDMLVSGEQDGTMRTAGCNQQPADLDANYNTRGAAGCKLPATKISGGYDVFTRRLKGRAWETDPVCALDLYLRKHYNAYMEMLRRELPMRAKEQFVFDLQRNVIGVGRYNTSVVSGFVHQPGSFPAVPTGLLDIGTIRRTFQILRTQGWTGAPEILVSHEAFEVMRLNYKRNTGLEINTTVVSNESQYVGLNTTVVEFAGIRFILTDRPLRGYLKPTANGFEFVQVLPISPRQGTGQGIVADVNEDYFNCYTYCDGVKYEVFEVGLYVHSMAAQREAFAAPPVGSKRFSNMLFNFEVNMIDGPYIDCNEDNTKFYHRLLHAYAFHSVNPELMGGVIFRVQPDQIFINEPVCDSDCDVEKADVALAQPPPPPKGDCEQCEPCDTEEEPFNPLLPLGAEDDPCPENNEGAFRFWSCGPLIVAQGTTTLMVGVERIGGTEGAATVDIDSTNGTASAGTDYTAVSDSLTWADGEGGVKFVEVTIAAGGEGTFELDLTPDDGETVVACNNLTVEIIECETPVTTTSTTTTGA